MHAALLAHEPVPLYLFSEGREKFGEPLSSALNDEGLDTAVASLRAFALIDRESIAGRARACNHHRLHAFASPGAPGGGVARRRRNAEDATPALLEVLTAVYPNPDSIWRDPKTWPRARRLDALALALVGGVATSPKEAQERARIFADGAAGYRHRSFAAFQAARPLQERALAIYESARHRSSRHGDEP